jgi:hypothetical protein
VLSSSLVELITVTLVPMLLQGVQLVCTIMEILNVQSVIPEQNSKFLELFVVIPTLANILMELIIVTPVLMLLVDVVLVFSIMEILNVRHVVQGLRFLEQFVVILTTGNTQK